MQKKEKDRALSIVYVVTYEFQIAKMALCDKFLP